MENGVKCPFALIYVNKVTKRKDYSEKTDNLFVISDFCCNFATSFQISV
jgi:hypothetical protein